MSRMIDVVTPRLWAALAIGSVVALLMPSLSTTTMDVPSAVALAALVMALAATVVLNIHVATLVARALALLPLSADDSPVFLAGRVTDPVHHPIRPRAPGMV